MMRWVKLTAFLVAVVLLVLTFVNASWLASAPVGTLKLIARGGVSQQIDPRAAAGDGCTARQIEPPIHDHLENTTRSMSAAWSLGADLIEVDVVPTRDGRLAVFGDAALECRTNGSGPVSGKTLAELQKLDPGYGYSPDGGRTFPLRGKGDKIPSVEDAIAALPITGIMFNFTTDDPDVAERLIRALKASDRDVVKRRDGFTGASGPVERMRREYPGAWAWTMAEAERCTRDYIPYGWATIVPQSCRNGTLLVPLNRQWLYAGWPNRLAGRMEAAGARVVLTGPKVGDRVTGLSLPEQLGQIPQSFKGYVLVDDLWTVAPALRPERDIRTLPQQNAAEAAAERRRQRMQ